MSISLPMKISRPAAGYTSVLLIHSNEVWSFPDRRMIRSLRSGSFQISLTRSWSRRTWSCRIRERCRSPTTWASSRSPQSASRLKFKMFCKHNVHWKLVDYRIFNQLSNFATNEREKMSIWKVSSAGILTRDFFITMLLSWLSINVGLGLAFTLSIAPAKYLSVPSFKELNPRTPIARVFVPLNVSRTFVNWK